MHYELPIIDQVEYLKWQQQYIEARKLLEGAIAKYGDRYELYEELADVYIYEWSFQKAQKALDYAETLESGSSTWLYLRGYISLIKNDFHPAVDYLERSNLKSPNNPEVLRNLGWAYTMIWDVKKWIILLERALTISPDDILIMEDLGVALLTQWKISEAHVYLTRVGRENHMSDMWLSV